MNVYRSSPALPSIFRPSHLIPSAYEKLVPDSKNSSEIEGFSSDDETANAEAAESAGDDNRVHSPSRSGDTHVGHPTSTRLVVRKRSSSSKATSDRYVASRL